MPEDFLPLFSAFCPPRLHKVTSRRQHLGERHPCFQAFRAGRPSTLLSNLTEASRRDCTSQALLVVARRRILTVLLKRRHLAAQNSRKRNVDTCTGDRNRAAPDGHLYFALGVVHHPPYHLPRTGRVWLQRRMGKRHAAANEVTPKAFFDAQSLTGTVAGK